MGVAVLIAIVLGLIVVGGGTYFFMQDEPSSWESFNNSNHGYSFKYPSSIPVSQVAPDGRYGLDDLGWESSARIGDAIPQGIPLAEVYVAVKSIDAVIADFTKAYSGTSVQIIGTSDAVINGKPAKVTRRQDPSRPDLEARTYVIEYAAGKVLILGSSLQDAGQIKLIDRIAHTIQEDN